MSLVFDSQEFKRSAFHAREWDAARLEKLQEPVDVVISYDWPRGTHGTHGMCRQLGVWQAITIDQRDYETYEAVRHVGRPKPMLFLGFPVDESGAEYTYP